jgi:hypothetical protein
MFSASAVAKIEEGKLVIWINGDKGYNGLAEVGKKYDIRAIAGGGHLRIFLFHLIRMLHRHFNAGLLFKLGSRPLWRLRTIGPAG